MILPMLLIAIRTGPRNRHRAPRGNRFARDVAFAGPLPEESDGDIVVCGKRDAAERDRLRALPEKYAPVAGPGTGVDRGKGMRANLYPTSEIAPDGKIGKPIMVKLTRSS